MGIFTIHRISNMIMNYYEGYKIKQQPQFNF